MNRLGIRTLLPLLALLAIALFPPWVQDDPAAPGPGGTKYSRGHAFILTRPAPGVAPDYRLYAPPVTIPVELDREQWLREALTLLVVSSLLAALGTRSALNPRLRVPWHFGRRTVALAILSALVMPLPDVGPVAFLPIYPLTDSNHGIPGWVAMLVFLAILSCVSYLALRILASFIHRLAPHAAQISARKTA